MTPVADIAERMRAWPLRAGLTAVVIPHRVTGDEWRARALDYVRAWWARHYPALTVIDGTIDEAAEWSKGAAAAAGVEEAIAAGAEILVIADGDSFTGDPGAIRQAIELVELGRPWAIPHGFVHRLTEAETARVLDDPTHRPRLGKICRPLYEGPAGGGITVLTVDAWRTVGGIDARFVGWGGEDLAFGWALETLVGLPERVGASLVHLWHPHPAPELRGSPESEALVADYTAARGFPRRMRAVLDGVPVTVEPLANPIRFRMTANRRQLRVSGRNYIRFTQGIYETSDPDEADWLRRHPAVIEETRRT